MVFWMHRCGSTTAQLWFFEAAGWKSRMQGKGASQIAPLWYEEHANIYSDLPRILNAPGYRKLAVVRNPFSRVVSAYSVVTDTISGAQWKAVSRGLRNPDENRRLTFREFLTFLESIDLSTANYHWRLQSAQDWVGKSMEDVDLARVETLQADLDTFARKIGIEPVSVRLSSATTKVKKYPQGVDVTQLTRPQLARHFGRDRRGVIRFPDYRNFLNEKTIPRIAKLYALDFAALNYPTDP